MKWRDASERGKGRPTNVTSLPLLPPLILLLLYGIFDEPATLTPRRFKIRPYSSTNSPSLMRITMVFSLLLVGGGVQLQSIHGWCRMCVCVCGVGGVGRRSARYASASAPMHCHSVTVHVHVRTHASDLPSLDYRQTNSLVSNQMSVHQHFGSFGAKIFVSFSASLPPNLGRRRMHDAILHPLSSSFHPQ